MSLYNIQLLLQQCIRKSFFITLQKKYSKKLLAVLKWLIFQMSSFSKSSSFIVLPLRRKMAFWDSSTVVQVSCDSLKDNSMPSARFFPPLVKYFVSRSGSFLPQRQRRKKRESTLFVSFHRGFFLSEVLFRHRPLTFLSIPLSRLSRFSVFVKFSWHSHPLKSASIRSLWRAFSKKTARKKKK